MEYPNNLDFRADGRKHSETRAITGKNGVLKKAHGSAYVEQGKTKVLVGIYGPQEIKVRSHSGKMIINCQCNLAPFGPPDKKYEIYLGELARLLKQIFESAIISQCYANSQIDIFLEILEHDGSAVACSINATTLALVDAGIKLKGLVCSSSCGCVKNKTLVDLTYLEEQQSCFMLTVALLPSVYNQILMHRLKGKLHESQFDEATETAAKACKDVFDNLNEICNENFNQDEQSIK